MKKKNKIFFKIMFLSIGVSIIYSIFIFLIARYVSIYLAILAIAFDFKLFERQKEIKKYL